MTAYRKYDPYAPHRPTAAATGDDDQGAPPAAPADPAPAELTGADLLKPAGERDLPARGTKTEPAGKLRTKTP